MTPIFTPLRLAAVVGIAALCGCGRTDSPAPARVKPEATAATVTAMDQGNDRSDLDTTQIIRQAIVGIPGLSVTAQNVLVVTTKGDVTVRGTVKDAGESELVMAAANTAAGKRRVDNQLTLAAR